jgi:hypothetical protein
VLPVGCPLNELKAGSENVDPVAVVEGVEGLAFDEFKKLNDGVVG